MRHQKPDVTEIESALEQAGIDATVTRVGLSDHAALVEGERRRAYDITVTVVPE